MVRVRKTELFCIYDFDFNFAQKIVVHSGGHANNVISMKMSVSIFFL